MSNLPELKWMHEAKRHLGMHEIKNASILKDWQKDLGVAWLGINPAWCGIYIAKVFQNCNMTYPKDFYRAASYRTFKTQLTRPAYGCLAVKSRKGGNHVAFVAGKLADGRLVCLGGNQSDSVCYAIYKVSDFDTFIWAGLGKAPDNKRYNLPVLYFDNKLNVKVTEA